VRRRDTEAECPRGECLFSSCGGGLAGQLPLHPRVRCYRKGQVLFYEGDLPEMVYCVRRGRIKLYRSTACGEHQIVHLAGVGELLGLPAVISGLPYEFAAESIEETVACRVPAEAVRRHLTWRRDLMSFVMRQLSAELLRSYSRLSMLREPVRSRLARLLLDLTVEDAGPSNRKPRDPRVPLRKKELAEMVGAAPETVSRALHELLELGAIELTRHEVRIQNAHLLQELTA
jgi:CRP-like cAMP-binding protein